MNADQAINFQSDTQHSDENGVKVKQGRFVCFYCGNSFYHAKRLTLHIENEHKLSTVTETHIFQSWDEFLKWKEEEETTSHTYYVNRSGASYSHERIKDDELQNSSTESIQTTLYVCCRDGKKRSHEERTIASKPRLHTKSRKLEDFCLARMIAKEYLEKGKVEVEYMKTHTNHEVDIGECKYLPLPKSTKKEIEQQFAMGKSLEKIMDDIRSGIGNRERRSNFFEVATRKHFITKQDCRNICRKLRNFSSHRHAEDAISVDRIVVELNQESPTPVLLYKPQGVTSMDYPGLPPESFLLVIMTGFQASLLCQYSQRIVCLDSTHKTNQYRFKLLTVIVADEYRNGHPVVWAISDKEDADTIEAMWNAIRKRCPQAEINTLMTDDDLAGMLACSRVYSGVRHILCIWHVDRAWQRKLNSIVKCQQHRAELYACLRMLMTEETEEKFDEHERLFFKYWESREPQFVTYYRNEYSHRAEKWALCHRHYDHHDTDTNMLVESFHNKLKTNPRYMAHKVNRRCDDLIGILLKIEEDMFHDRMRKEVMETPQAASLKVEGQERHERGKNISDNCVQKMQDDLYLVSSTPNETKYTVQILKTDCEEMPACVPQCHMKECQNLCRHMFKCTCTDYVHGHICKHVHKVNLMCKDENMPVTCHTHDDEVQPQDSSSKACISQPMEIQEKRSTTAKRKAIEECATEIVCAADEIDDDSTLDRVMTLLLQAHATMTAATTLASATTVTEKFEKKEHFFPAQKNEIQLRFKQTIAKPGRKKQTVPLRLPSKEQQHTWWDDMDTEIPINSIESHNTGQHSHITGQHSHETKQHSHETEQHSHETDQCAENSKSRKRTMRCGQCTGCKMEECGSCAYCKDMKKFGGPGKKKKACIRRKCLQVLLLPPQADQLRLTT